MEYAKLGKTEIEISRITHGCMELGGGPDPSTVWAVQSEELNQKLILQALDKGVTLFDTAESYGQGLSEMITGRALKAVRREKYLLATKVSPGHLNPDGISRSIEGSLKRLGVSYVDLYYIHMPNDSVPISETMGRMNKLKSEGLIRAIGVSNFSLKQLEEALLYGEISALQPEYNLLSRNIEGDLLPFCKKNSISILSYNSIAKGILSGAFHFYGAKLDPVDFRNRKPLFRPDNLERELPLLELMRKMASEKSATISQVAIAWLLRQGGVSSAIVGTQNERHFLENLDAISLELSIDEIEILSKVSSEVLTEVGMN
ncbi:MAG: aldo/keto reductase [Clostridiales bacterium]|jgi:aryl-alcohol dehydrogenase-like predicted oxidoreductase|nr:aldo/keto reductase [Clostridiales bacterium]